MAQYRMAFLETPYLMVASEADSFQISSRNLGHRPETDAELAYVRNHYTQVTRRCCVLLGPVLTLLLWLHCRRGHLQSARMTTL